MELERLVFGPGLLRIVGWRIGPGGVTILVVPAEEYGFCPSCGHRSARVHSRHRRKLQDLPAFGHVVVLELHLCRFFCDCADCPQRTFAQQIPQIAPPHARRTRRVAQALEDIAFTAGGEAGARLAGELGMAASGDTLLRLLRRAARATAPNSPKVLGVDDWARRRGQVYGTILCDLEAHRPVDLLPDRSADTLARWLRQHPGARIISRDRGGEYARGASQGAPDAVQVADRWHLLKNLTEALQCAVDRRSGLLTEVGKEVAAAFTPRPPPAGAPTSSGTATSTPLLSDSADTAVAPPSPPPLSRREQKRQSSRARRMARYQAVQELYQQNVCIRAIGRQLKINRNTVKHWLACGQFPEHATPRRSRPIDRYLPFLRQQWEAGCDNAPTLHKQLQEQGFKGSVFMVRRQIGQWRKASGIRARHGPRPVAATPQPIRPSARRMAWLALGHVTQPTAQDQAILTLLCQRWPQLQESAELARQFAGLLKEHDADSLEAWAQLAEGSMIVPEVRRFAQVLRQDWAAVLAAIKLPWSQGQVEGQINRLKLIKRQMYGRAGFDLLRSRVLHRRPA